MMSDITKTPKEELECKKKYLYEYSMFWECNDGSKCQILEEDVCDLLNELNKEFEDCEKLLDSKDDFIHKFKRDIEELGISIKLFEDDIATKDKKIEEQQATIRKLQDLCGESDSENAKLRIENKRLQEENEQLKKQIQIYEQLISNSYVGEEETLDGFVGKYVIWEDELQKYRKKIKKGD